MQCNPITKDYGIIKREFILNNYFYFFILEAKAKSLFPRKKNVLAMNIKKNTRKKAKN